MFGKKKQSAAIDQAIASGASFEVSIGDLARKSERRAWFVAFAAMAMSLVLAGGYYYMLPLKTIQPYVVMSDPFSGTATVAPINNDGLYQSTVAYEVVARANIANYVTARESFDRQLLADRDWLVVNVMSGPDEQRAYRALHADDNPESPAKLVRPNEVIRVRILTVTPVDGGGEINGATVRFQRSLLDRDRGESRLIDNRIVTLTYRYNPNLELAENLRWLNPLGFQVLQYRSDPDLTETPLISGDTMLRDASAALGLASERDAAINALRLQQAQAQGEGNAGTLAPSGAAPVDTGAGAPTQGAPPVSPGSALPGVPPNPNDIPPPGAPVGPAGSAAPNPNVPASQPPPADNRNGAQAP